jgi:lysozyme family protein
MQANFKSSLAAVLVHEGGYVNHPRDPGGATNKGITHRTYAAYLARNKMPATDVRHITDAEVASIYRNQYWSKVMGDDLPSGVDYAVFDFAVNSGPARAAKFLQRIVGVTADGVIGFQTLSAVAKMDAGEIVAKLCANRLAWLKRLKHWDAFGRGWERRVLDVANKAGRMVRDLPSATATIKEPQAKADGPITTTAAIGEAMKDPKAIGGAVAVAAPAASTILTGDGPVQWAIGGVLVIAAIGVAFWLWQRGRDE